MEPNEEIEPVELPSDIFTAIGYQLPFRTLFRLSLTCKRLRKSAFGALTQVSQRDSVFFTGKRLRLSDTPLPLIQSLVVSEALRTDISNLAVVLRGCKTNLRILDFSLVTLPSFTAFEELVSSFPPVFPSLNAILLPKLAAAPARETRVVREVFSFFADGDKFPSLSQIVAHHIGGETPLSFILPHFQPSVRLVTLPPSWIPSNGALDLVNFDQLDAICFPDQRITISRIMEYFNPSQLNDSVPSKLFRSSMHSPHRGLFFSLLALQVAVEASDPASYAPLVSEENVARALVMHDTTGLSTAHIGFAFALQTPIYARWNDGLKPKNADLLKLVDPRALVYERHHIHVDHVCPLMEQTLAPFSVMSPLSLFANCVMAFGIPKLDSGRRGYGEPDLHILHHILLPNHRPPQGFTSNKALLDESKYALEQNMRNVPSALSPTWLQEIGVRCPADAMRDPDSGVTLLMLSLSCLVYPQTNFSAYNVGVALPMWLLKHREALGLNVNEVDHAGNSALHYACDVSCMGRLPEIFGLLEAGADIALHNKRGVIPFQLMAKEFFQTSPDKDPELERLFFKFIFASPFFNPTTRSSATDLVMMPMKTFGGTPLLLTLVGYNYPLFSALLDRMPTTIDRNDVSKLMTRAARGDTVLHLAATDLRFLRRLMAVLTQNDPYKGLARKLLGCSNADGYSPLALAVLSKEPNEAVALLSVIADIGHFQDACPPSTSLLTLLNANHIASNQDKQLCRRYLQTMLAAGQPSEAPSSVNVKNLPTDGSCRVQ